MDPMGMVPICFHNGWTRLDWKWYRDLGWGPAHAIDQLSGTKWRDTRRLVMAPYAPYVPSPPIASLFYKATTLSTLTDEWGPGVRCDQHVFGCRFLWFFDAAGSRWSLNGLCWRWPQPWKWIRQLLGVITCQMSSTPLVTFPFFLLRWTPTASWLHRCTLFHSSQQLTSLQRHRGETRWTHGENTHFFSSWYLVSPRFNTPAFQKDFTNTLNRLHLCFFVSSWFVTFHHFEHLSPVVVLINAIYISIWFHQFS